MKWMFKNNINKVAFKNVDLQHRFWACFSTVGIRKNIQREKLSINLVDSAYPWFLTGFADAECCFYVGIQKSTKVRTGRFAEKYNPNLN